MTHHLTLLSILEQAKPALDQIAEADWTNKPNPEKWSKIEIIGHLIDSAHNNHIRFTTAAIKKNLIFNGYDQDHWVQHNAYQSRNYESILSLFFAANTHLFYAITSLDPELITQQSHSHNFDQIAMRTVSKHKPTTLGYLIEDYIFHLEHHLAQVIENYQFLAR